MNLIVIMQDFITLLLVCVLIINSVVCVFEETASTVSVELDQDQIVNYFAQTDTDGNGFLDREEVQKWVKIMVDAHLKDSVPAAKTEFRSVDVNRDRIATWDEYRIVMKSIHKDDEHVYSEQEQKHKFRQADENGDNVLNQIEYVAFKNPMTTSYVLNRIAHELLEDFDADQDKRVSVEEFIYHEASRVEDVSDEQIDKLREMEFKGVMDANDDGFLDVEELKDYLDPRGTNFIKNEARHMMHESDTNKDRKLSLEEIKKNYLHFQSHKQNPVIKAIHDEF